MVEHLQGLSLQADRVGRLRDVSVDLGKAHLRNAESRQDAGRRELAFFAAATNFRRAASHSLLLDDIDEAKQLFHESATAYLSAGSAYGLFLQNLGHGEFKGGNYPLEVPNDASHVYWLWNPDYLRTPHGIDHERLGMVRRRLDGYRTERVGILGIRVGTYLDLFDSFDASEDRIRGVVANALLPIVATYSAAVRQAREDDYHWTRLATPFHPLEPDVIATLVAVGRALKVNNGSIAEVLAAMPIAKEALLLLRGGLQQYDVWNDGEWPFR